MAFLVGLARPERVAPSLARDVPERVHDGDETADQVLRAHGAVVDDLLLCLGGGDLSLFLLKE